MCIYTVYIYIYLYLGEITMSTGRTFFPRPVLFNEFGRPKEVLKKQCGVRARTGGFLWCGPGVVLDKGDGKTMVKQWENHGKSLVV